MTAVNHPNGLSISALLIKKLKKGYIKKILSKCAKTGESIPNDEDLSESVSKIDKVCQNF